MGEDSKFQDNRLHSAEAYARPDPTWLLSGVYCMLIVILSIVICSSHFSTRDVSEVAVDIYYIVLTLIGTIWLVTFGPIATSCGRNPKKHEEVKSTHSTNRWLKGILVIFGIAIIIKDLLEVITNTEYDDAECQKVVFYLAPLSELIFTVAEVSFLFRYSKLHLQGMQQLNRFGTMHVMATNLSIWVLIIIDESMSGMHSLTESTLSTTPSTLFTGTPPTLIAGCNTTELIEILNNSGITLDGRHQEHHSYGAGQIFGPGGCICNTSYCGIASDAHTFLYPFLVEFSLVASCMMYIVWKNIGTQPHRTEPPVKPSYKFYKSYKGLALGTVILIVTIVVLIFINYGVEPLAPNESTAYDDHIDTMKTCNGYLVGCEVFMLIACCIGIGLYRRDPRRLTIELDLDVVLLLVTLAGSSTINMYYAFSVYASFISPNYKYKWIWGAVYPIVDLLQCIVQVGFLLGGLARNPIADLDESIEMSNSHSISGSNDSGYTNDTFTPDDGVPTELQKQAEALPISGTKTTDFSSSEDAEKNKDSDMVEIQPSPNENEVCGIATATTRHLRHGFSQHRVIEENALKERIRKHQERPRVAPPNLIRLYERETLMFLLMANACLWLFWSFEGPNLKVFSYPGQYFAQNIPHGSRNVWETATMFCLPLAIFFRMHSCAVLFEVWSFT